MPDSDIVRGLTFCSELRAEQRVHRARAEVLVETDASRYARLNTIKGREILWV